MLASKNGNLNSLQTYPSSDAVRSILLTTIGDREGLTNPRIQKYPPEITALAELWLTEGIPEIFKNSGYCYHSFRTMLADRIQNNVHAKDITIVGSTRLGYSLAPYKFGQPFNSIESDLDICAISPTLFAALKVEADEFVEKIKKEKSEFESINIAADRTRKNLLRNFIQTSQLPPRNKITATINSAVENAFKALNSTPEFPKTKKATMRVYANWEAASNQISLNLEDLGLKLRDAR